MVSALKKQTGDNPDIRLGVAPHSLRAVNPPMLKDLVRPLLDRPQGSGPYPPR